MLVQLRYSGGSAVGSACCDMMAYSSVVIEQQLQWMSNSTVKVQWSCCGSAVGSICRVAVHQWFRICGAVGLRCEHVVSFRAVLVQFG